MGPGSCPWIISEIPAGPGGVHWVREHPGICNDCFFPYTHSFTKLLLSIDSGFPMHWGAQLGALGPPTGLDTWFPGLRAREREVG